MDTNKKNNIVDDVKETLTERLRSPFYGTFIISWCLWNWKVFFITFFIDSELLFKYCGILKINYIANLYPWNLSLWAVWTVSKILILPFVSSCVIIYLMPLLTTRFYKKYLETYNEQESLKIMAETKIINLRNVKLEAEKKLATTKRAKSEVEENLSKKWDSEYEIFARKEILDDLSRLIYDYRGELSTSHQARILYGKIGPYLNPIGLIDNDGGIVSLTEKGKYFLSKRLSENKN